MTHISIAMATYNGAGFIREQLESFAAQDRLPDELVVADDASTDDTARIVEDFATEAPFDVHLACNQRQLGFNKNFEKALSLCRGDVILLSDQDDTWFKHKVSIIAKIFDDNPKTYAVTNDHLLVDRSGQSMGRTVLQNIRRLGYSDRLFGPGCCMSFRKEILDLLVPFPNDAQYDYWMSYITDLLGARILLDIPLQTYRRHGSNTLGAAPFYKRRPTMLTIAQNARQTDVRAAFRRRIEAIDALLTNLQARRSQVSRLGLEGRYQFAVNELTFEKEDYSRRLECLALNRFRRAGAVVGALRQGKYERFSGWKSAVKDLIS